MAQEDQKVKEFCEKIEQLEKEYGLSIHSNDGAIYVLRDEREVYSWGGQKEPYEL